MSSANPRRTRSANTPRFVKNPHPEPSKVRKVRVSSRSAAERDRAASPERSRRTTSRPGAEPKETRSRKQSNRLPGWKDLSDSNTGPEKGRPAHLTLLDAVPTFRVALMILAAAAVVTLYVGHVLATQELMSRAETLRRENLALHLRYNRVKGAFDLASGPSVIYDRARALGLTEQVPNGPSIELD